ncbi:MAG: tRNA lysidine(34) synthetase TilS [Desulfovibrionaceae bacterium]|nr:tRNA lysidine(34) synthetase TilS [Desulfovibrionaceae bacterium]
MKQPLRPLDASPERETPPPAPGPEDLPASFPTLGTAPAKAARLAIALEKQLRALGVREGDCLLCAVSGGADSTALACLMALVAPRLRLRAPLVTCDHGLRPESAAEADFVEALGRLLGLAVIRLTLALDRAGTGLEERARSARYEAMARVMEEQGAQWLVTAHHAGDLREDMVLRLLRGTGWPGLGGMEAGDAERRLLRPLLDVEPSLLREVLAELGIPHCEDASNLDTKFARNRIRHEILPVLERENPRLDRALMDLARLARVDAAFFAAETEKAMARCRRFESDGRPALFAPMAVLCELPSAVRLRLYMALVRALVRDGAKGQARAETLYRLDMALAARSWPGRYQLPGGLVFTLERKGLTLACPRSQDRQD